MANTKVARHVHVVNPETGERAWLEPGDTVPAEFKDCIVNPKAFEDVPEDDDNILEQQDYERLEVKDLKALAKSRNLDNSGNKAELVHRLTLHDAGLS